MSNKQKNILLVDDVEDIREGISEILQDDGYSISTASNGKEALRILRNRPIDLVITDILMPEMDGLELIEKTKDLYLPDLEFILISGGGRRLTSDYDYLEVTKKLTGISNVLKKPFHPDKLIKMVNNLLAD